MGGLGVRSFPCGQEGGGGEQQPELRGLQEVVHGHIPPAAWGTNTTVSTTDRVFISENSPHIGWYHSEDKCEKVHEKKREI